mgnify:CR=1 FL=1
MKIGICSVCSIEKKILAKKMCKNCYEKTRYGLNPIYGRNKTKKWRSKNPEKVKIQKNRNYYKHKEEQIEKRRLYRHTEKGRIVGIRKREKRRVKSMFLSESYTTIEWITKLDNTNGICPCCSKFVGKDKLEIDHIIPISKAPIGFNYTINDIQPLCKSCNSKKGNKMVIIK